jgi:hypothetical protein
MPRRFAVSCQLIAGCCLAAFPAVLPAAPDIPSPPASTVERPPAPLSAIPLTAVFDRTGKLADHWTTEEAPVALRAAMDRAVRTAIPPTGPTIAKTSDGGEEPPTVTFSIRPGQPAEASVLAPLPAVQEPVPMSPTLPLVVGGGVAAAVFLVSFLLQYGRRA